MRLQHKSHELYGLGNKRGLTLVEALVGNILILIVLVSSLTIFKSILEGQKDVDAYLDYIVARNQIVNQIIDDRGWSYIVQSALNSSTGGGGLSCYLLQDQQAVGSRDCRNSVAKNGQLLNIYNIRNELIYDFQNAKTGLTPKGRACTTYAASGSGSSPDPNCALKLNLRATSVCPAAGNCVNPPLQLVGDFEYNSGNNQKVPPLGILNFKFIKAGFYCPTQAPVTISNIGGATITAGKQVTSNQNTAFAPSDYGSTNPSLMPCREVDINFLVDYPASAPVGYSLSDAGNLSKVCLVETSTGVCFYEFRLRYNGTNYIYELFYKGALQWTMPTWLALSPNSTQFEFLIQNGMVKFCVNGKCYHYFEQKLEFPFDVWFTPLNIPYSSAMPNPSSGLNNITILTQEY